MNSYWEQLLEEVLNKKNKRRFYFANIAAPKINENKKQKPVIFKTQSGAIISLSQRESECTWYALRGKTVRETAILLELSHRTVESYLNSAKQKINCKNKPELINFILHSNFAESFIKNKKQK